MPSKDATICMILYLCKSLLQHLKFPPEGLQLCLLYLQPGLSILQALYIVHEALTSRNVKPLHCEHPCDNRQ